MEEKKFSSMNIQILRYSLMLMAWFGELVLQTDQRKYRFFKHLCGWYLEEYPYVKEALTLIFGFVLYERK